MNEPDMHQEDVIDENAKTELTPDEYAKQRELGKQHLTAEIKYLIVEEKYQKLLADIEQHKTRRMTMIGQRVQYYAQQRSEPQDQTASVDQATPSSKEENPTKETKPRKLKT